MYVQEKERQIFLAGLVRVWDIVSRYRLYPIDEHSIWTLLEKSISTH